MTYSDFLRELSKASLSVRDFALLVRMNRNSISNYAQVGEVPGHLGLIAALVAELHVHGINYTPIVARAAPPIKKPRGRARPGRFGGNPQEQLDI